jgi:predicted acetyltransferase
VFDGGPAGRLAGVATSFPARTAVPGGAALPTAAVSRVGVRADRTRRGLLTALMHAQLDDCAARGDVLATLRASEPGIYGRFGYGVATRGRAVRLPGRAALRAGAPAGGTVRLLEPAEAVPVLAGVHNTLALLRPGGMTRPPGWWTGGLARAVAEREPMLAAVHTGPAGDDGFAVARPVPGAGFTGTLRLGDLHAADAAATAGLWRFLLGVDLVDAVEADLRPLDEPLELLLADPRACAVTGITDEAWLRLVDVPAALAARAFPPGPAPVLLAVHDALLPGNAGVYRIGGGAAERVGPLGSAEPELSCDVAALAMAYLGDRAPSTLVATGWWHAADGSAVPRADALFGTAAAPPWCGTYF